MAVPIAAILSIVGKVFGAIKPFLAPLLAFWKGKREGHAKAKAQANEHFNKVGQDISDAVAADRRKRVRSPDAKDPYQRD